MSSNKTNLVNVANVEVCRVCENDFEQPNIESIYCDGCKKWIHLHCCEYLSMSLIFMLIMKILFIVHIV